MKNALFLFSFLTFHVVVFSQNWQPIVSSETYHFVLENSTQPVYTIKVDSVEFTGSDSIFYLNRIACENCTTIIGGPANCDTCYGKYNQPQFLQRVVTLSTNSVVTFSDTTEFVLKPNASVSDTWQYSVSSGITAEVVGVSITDVLGNSDSVKTISLSSGDTILLSKNHGLLQFPFSAGSGLHYYITGIETQQLGFVPPKMKDFFNFDVGDMFEYRGDYGNGGSQYQSYSIRKYEVVSKLANGDTIEYHIQGNERMFWSTGYPNPTGGMVYSVIDRDLIFIDSVKHFGNNYNHELFDLSSIIKKWSGSDQAIFTEVNWLYDITKTEYDTLGLFTKQFGITYPPTGLLKIDTIPETMFREYWGGPESALKYKEGLGQTDFNFFHFEYNESEYLVAYRKGNDTVGVFTPDSNLIIGVNENQFSTLTLYPNPATSSITIEFPASSTFKNAELSILTITGQVINELIIDNEKLTINTEHFSKGVYFFKVETGDEIVMKKVIVK
jgi:hypothetical protein